mmetsp:Transcript_14978/g.29150  ORF Transcript_14978/g.29150 Transcript_14978/m.29150 type:complete len:995 (-) Transcript_14978:270-3254(-)|eukprot:CAMPEP_0171496720 /NCGR_PEP_ID=MMETSP0958-20121227/6864_1 /TAXON_ID=87120 /ORGANISM="Aurantiochytrium limacinum, Strain ATCCMYA-1381" /LENGTH=994 /DNA_ID=CAMNT_0012030865 /DNA_START=630 /DNA_END=3614 /DNA_ORIENTATION=-
MGDDADFGTIKRKTSELSDREDPMSPPQELLSPRDGGRSVRAVSRRSWRKSLSSADDTLEKHLMFNPVQTKPQDTTAEPPEDHQRLRVLSSNADESDFDYDDEVKDKQHSLVYEFFYVRPFKCGLCIFGAIITIAGACMKGINKVDVRQVPEALLFVGTSFMMGLVADIIAIGIGGFLTWLVTLAEKKRHNEIAYTIAVSHFYYTSVVYRFALLLWVLLIIVMFTSWVPRESDSTAIVPSWELAYFHVTRLLGILAMVLFSRILTRFLRMYLTQDFGIRSFAGRVKDSLDREMLCCKLRNVRPNPAFVSLLSRLKLITDSQSYADPELWQAVVRHVNTHHVDGFEVATGKHAPVKPGQDPGLSRRARPVAASIFARIIETIKMRREEMLMSESNFYSRVENADDSDFEYTEEEDDDENDHTSTAASTNADSSNKDTQQSYGQAAETTGTTIGSFIVPPPPTQDDKKPEDKAAEEDKSTTEAPAPVTRSRAASRTRPPPPRHPSAASSQAPGSPPLVPLRTLTHVPSLSRHEFSSGGGPGRTVSRSSWSVNPEGDIVPIDADEAAAAAAASAASSAIRKFNMRRENTVRFRQESFRTLRSDFQPTEESVSSRSGAVEDHHLVFDPDSEEEVANKAESHLREIEEVPLEALAAIAEEIEQVKNADIGTNSKRELLSHLSSRLGNKIYFKEEVIDAFQQLDSAYDWEKIWKEFLDPRDTGVLTWPRLRTMILDFYEQRYNLSLSLQDSKSVIKSMDVTIMSVFIVLVILISLTFYTTDIATMLSSIGTVILGYSFIFGGSVTTSFENIIFLFGIHPYDVGDALLFNNNRYTVSRIRLLTTDFVQADGAMMRLTNTYVASLGPIFNLNTSENHSVAFTVYLPATDVRESNITEIRKSLDDFFRVNTASFAGYGFTARDFLHPLQANGELPAKSTHATHIQFVLWVTFTFSFEDAGRIFEEQTRLITHLCEKLEEMGLSKPLVEENHRNLMREHSGGQY